MSSRISESNLVEADDTGLELKWPILRLSLWISCSSLSSLAICITFGSHFACNLCQSEGS